MSDGEHGKWKKAELAGAVGVGVAAVGGASYAAWRRQHRDGHTFDADPNEAYRHRLEIFNEERLKPQIREILAPLAVRIHHATFNSAEQIITRASLSGLLPNINLSNINRALGYLQGDSYSLIGRRPSAMNEKVQGYYSKPPLNWALEQGEGFDVLFDAYKEMVDGQLNDSFRRIAGTPDPGPEETE